LRASKRPLLNEAATLARLSLSSCSWPSVARRVQVGSSRCRAKACQLAVSEVSRCVASGPSAVESKSVRFLCSQTLAPASVASLKRCASRRVALRLRLPSWSALAPGANGPGRTCAVSIEENGTDRLPASVADKRVLPKLRVTLALPLALWPLPPSACSATWSAPPPRVKICTTPPMASEPYRLDRLPRTISMRSTLSRLTPPRTAKPPIAVFSRMPSTSTSTCALPAPRANSEVWLPGPPVRVNCRPGCRASSSGSEGACVRSMSSRVMSVTGASKSAKGCSVRAAVITTGCS